MTRRAALIVVALVAAALVGVALLAIPSSPLHQKPTLGLDLQGGLEVVLKAEPPKGHKLTPEDLGTLDGVSALAPEYPGWMLARQAAGREPPAQ